MPFDQKRYTCADVGIRSDRPFRMSTSHLNQTGSPVQPGDDPDASNASSRMLVYFLTEPLPTTDVAMHSHEFYEFVFVRRSSGTVHVTELGEEELCRGDVIIMAPDAMHGFQSFIGLVKTELYFQPQWLSDELRLILFDEGLVRALLSASLFRTASHTGHWVVHLDEAQLARCEMELDSLLDEARGSQPSLVFYNGCFFKLLSVLNGAFVQQHGESVPAIDPLVWRTSRLIDHAISRGEPLVIDQLAAEVGLSRRHLSRVFKAAAGMTMAEYYRERRVQVAAQRLTCAGESVVEMAHALCFSDEAHFIRVFRASMGVTPGVYRKAHLKKRGHHEASV